MALLRVSGYLRPNINFQFKSEMARRIYNNMDKNISVIIPDSTAGCIQIVDL